MNTVLNICVSTKSWFGFKLTAGESNFLHTPSQPNISLYENSSNSLSGHLRNKTSDWSNVGEKQIRYITLTLDMEK